MCCCCCILFASLPFFPLLPFSLCIAPIAIARRDDNDMWLVVEIAAAGRVCRFDDDVDNVDGEVEDKKIDIRGIFVQDATHNNSR